MSKVKGMKKVYCFFLRFSEKYTFNDYEWIESSGMQWVQYPAFYPEFCTLWAYTTDKKLALEYESQRNKKKFKMRSLWLSDEQFDDLENERAACRIKESAFESKSGMIPVIVTEYEDVVTACSANLVISDILENNLPYPTDPFRELEYMNLFKDEYVEVFKALDIPSIINLGIDTDWSHFSDDMSLFDGIDRFAVFVYLFHQIL